MAAPGNTPDSFICGVFTGFRPGAVFKLADGTFWWQDDNTTTLYRAVDPAAALLDRDDGRFLKVAGIDGVVRVRELQGVIESRIKGRFTGWTGRTVYTLTNGTRWQQAKYATKYLVKYMPEVLIYSSPVNPHGALLMQVAGTTVNVRRIG